jgi:hypothetical protein
MNEVWYDDCFSVKQNSSKLWFSENKNGEKLITSLTEINCISATRFYLKRKQEMNW